MIVLELFVLQAFVVCMKQEIFVKTILNADQKTVWLIYAYKNLRGPPVIQEVNV